MGFLTAAAGTFSVGDTLYKLAVESGFAGLVVDGGWRNLVMISFSIFMASSTTSTSPALTA